MPDLRRIFGNAAEGLAEEYLKDSGMRILSRQYKTKIGEIDLIAKDGDEVVFIEVKARQDATFGYPEESVTPVKIKKIINVGNQYLKRCFTMETDYRIDVIAIEYHVDPPRITHIKNVLID